MDVASADGTPRGHRRPPIRRTNSYTSRRCGGSMKRGRFIDKVDRTGGVIVGMRDVQALEFFEA
jgi:hypothetical protein